MASCRAIMRQHALRQSSAPNSATDEVQPPTQEIVVAHPKIARRPTQWKRSTPVTIEQTATRIIPPSIATTPWQDDVRFGLLLVSMIFLINGLMVIATDTSRQSIKEGTVTLQQVTRTSILPTPHADSASRIHSFATTKETEEEESVRAFLKEHARLLEEMESPAPRATSFGSHHAQ